MSSTFIPSEDRVLVQLLPNESKTLGGIFIPEASQERTNKARVISVGPISGDRQVIFKVGQTIVYNRQAGIPLKQGGEDFLILEVRDIFGYFGD